MKYEILLNSVFRLSINKATKLLEEYQKNVGFNNFAEQQRVLDLITDKLNVEKMIKDEVFNEAKILICLMARDKGLLSKAAFENMKNFPIIIWIEAIGILKPNDIIYILNNYYNELPSPLIENLIINLPKTMQLDAIDKFYKYIDKDNELFSNFSYCLFKEARYKLKKYFPDKIDDDILLELKDLKEEEVVKRLLDDRLRLLKQSSDDLIEFILLKANDITTLNRFFELFNEKIQECSICKFKLLITRYKYLGNLRQSYFDYEENPDLISDIKLIKLFKNKFYEIGVFETLSLFDNITQYESNKFTVDVVLEFLDIAYFDDNLSKYINDETIKEMIEKFTYKCSNKNYSLENFKLLVNLVGKDGKTKLIFDDYIEAIIACGKLLKNNVITDKHPLFLKLREKFTSDLISRIKKDNTYLQDFSLNGIFYRLAKGSLSFDIVYMIKTYKGLIYLSKCGQLNTNADYITNFLTDEQLAKLNISPVIKWKNKINRSNKNADNLSFIERMGLQLLCYFGKDKGKYLLESDMQGNRMENIFDGLKYADISINIDGTSNINEELIDYIFGKGNIKEKNSVVNRMIRGEIPEFEKYFTEFCNSFEEIKTECNGILSVKRIVEYLEDMELPIKLKPDEIEFKQALREMNTTNINLLLEAIALCKDARNRDYSSIPKVEGKIGDFTYKILDLKDFMALIVGYLSHCCFTVGGVSYSALKHSMKSNNGRTFVVYYQGKFLTQSWVWRNGDVVCFDSVEAGSLSHSVYKDDIKLVDVYKKAANEILDISKKSEDIIQQIKVVTVGKSDYIFNNLELLKGDVPKPLEKDVYVYDSSEQMILAGSMPYNVRYGVVGIKYKDPRKKVRIINEINDIDIDLLDELTLNINSLRYQFYGEESLVCLTDYQKIILGEDWYILFNKDGNIEKGILKETDEAREEFKEYSLKYIDNDKIYVKK